MTLRAPPRSQGKAHSAGNGESPFQGVQRGISPLAGRPSGRRSKRRATENRPEPPEVTDSVSSSAFSTSASLPPLAPQRRGPCGYRTGSRGPLIAIGAALCVRARRMNGLCRCAAVIIVTPTAAASAISFGVIRIPPCSRYPNRRKLPPLRINFPSPESLSPDIAWLALPVRGELPIARTKGPRPIPFCVIQAGSTRPP